MFSGLPVLELHQNMQKLQATPVHPHLPIHSMRYLDFMTVLFTHSLTSCIEQKINSGSRTSWCIISVCCNSSPLLYITGANLTYLAPQDNFSWVPNVSLGPQKCKDVFPQR